MKLFVGLYSHFMVNPPQTVLHAVQGIRDGLTRDDFKTSWILGNFKGYMLLKTSKNLILKRDAWEIRHWDNPSCVKLIKCSYVSIKCWGWKQWNSGTLSMLMPQFILKN